MNGLNIIGHILFRIRDNMENKSNDAEGRRMRNSCANPSLAKRDESNAQPGRTIKPFNDVLVCGFDLFGKHYDRQSAQRFEEHFPEFLEGYSGMHDYKFRYHIGFHLCRAADYIDNKLTGRPEFENLSDKDILVLDRIRPDIGLRDGFDDHNWQYLEFADLECVLRDQFGSNAVYAGAFDKASTLRQCFEHVMKNKKYCM